MADLSAIKQHMEVIGADGVHVGTVDRVEGERIKPMIYRADFVYERATEPDCNGTVYWLREVEDAKGMKTKDYLLKKKLMQDKYGITIREV